MGKRTCQTLACHQLTDFGSNGTDKIQSEYDKSHHSLFALAKCEALVMVRVWGWHWVGHWLWTGLQWVSVLLLPRSVEDDLGTAADFVLEKGMGMKWQDVRFVLGAKSDSRYWGLVWN